MLMDTRCGTAPDLCYQAAGLCCLVHAEYKPQGGWEPEAQLAGEQTGREGKFLLFSSFAWRGGKLANEKVSQLLHLNWLQKVKNKTKNKNTQKKQL